MVDSIRLQCDGLSINANKPTEGERLSKDLAKNYAGVVDQEKQETYTCLTGHSCHRGVVLGGPSSCSKLY